MSEASHLLAYLDSHQAGASGGIEVAERLAASERDGELGRVLVHDLRDDRDAVHGLMKRLGGKPSATKAAVGWTAEKLSQLAPTRGDDDYDRLLDLEALVVGSRGRVAMFDALEAVLDEALALEADVERRRDRAQAHIEALEARRIEASRDALAPLG